MLNSTTGNLSHLTGNETVDKNVSISRPFIQNQK
jgi:hypothetical protein